MDHQSGGQLGIEKSGFGWKPLATAYYLLTGVHGKGLEHKGQLQFTCVDAILQSPGVVTLIHLLGRGVAHHRLQHLLLQNPGLGNRQGAPLAPVDVLPPSS